MMPEKRIYKSRISTEPAMETARQETALGGLQGADGRSVDIPPQKSPAQIDCIQGQYSPRMPSRMAFAEAVLRRLATESQFEDLPETMPQAEVASTHQPKSGLEALPAMDALSAGSGPPVIQLDNQVPQHKSTLEAPSMTPQPGLLEAAALMSEANKRIARAELAFKKAQEILAEARTIFEKSAAQLESAQRKEEQAREDLKSTQLELTTAYQFAAVAAERQKTATAYYRRANNWAIFASSIAWLSVVCLAWLVFRATVPVWAPAIATILLALAAYRVSRWADSDS